MEISTKSMNVGHWQPKHHCNPCTSSPTTLVSIIISKNIMLSIQNNLWSEKHTLPSCGVARIQLPGGLARARESPGGPAHGLFFASKIRCPLTKNALTFFSGKIFAWFFFVGKLWTCSIHFSQNKRLRSSTQKSRGRNVPHGAKIKTINTFPTQFNKKIVRPPKKVRKNENFQTDFFWAIYLRRRVRIPKGLFQLQKTKKLDRRERRLGFRYRE